MDLTGGRRPIVAGAEDVYRGGDRIWNPSSAATAANSPPAAPHGPYPLVVPTSDLSPAALGVLKPRVMGGIGMERIQDFRWNWKIENWAGPYCL